MNEQTMCTQTVEGGLMCGGEVTYDVTWIDPYERKDTIHNLVCTECADSLMGWAASHLKPSRNKI